MRKWTRSRRIDNVEGERHDRGFLRTAILGLRRMGADRDAYRLAPTFNSEAPPPFCTLSLRTALSASEFEAEIQPASTSPSTTSMENARPGEGLTICQLLDALRERFDSMYVVPFA